MLYKYHLITGLLTSTVSGCMHRGSTPRSTEASRIKTLTVQKSCDIDAFLCQNELDFSFPQDIFSLQLPSPSFKQNQEQRQERQASLPEAAVHSSSESYYYDPIDAVLNDMINFSMEMTSPIVIYSTIPEYSSSNMEFDAIEKIMDDMLSTFLDLSVSSSNPTLIIERVNSHGRRLLEEETDPVRERLARRLSSVQYAHHHGRSHNVMHSAIFNANVDKCLWKRLQEQTLISNDCSKAMNAYAAESNASKEEYELDAASLVVVKITFFIFTATTLLLFYILLTSNIGTASPSSTMGKLCVSLPLLALIMLLSYLSVTAPSFVIMLGTPVIILLGFYSCFVGDREDECDNCHVSTDSICSTCGTCVNCCQCLAAPILLSQQELKGGEVYVAVPAVI